MKKITIIGKKSIQEYNDVIIESIQLYNQKPNTWERKINKIIDEIDNNILDGTVIYLATPLFLQISREKYYEIWKKLLQKLNEVNSMILIYEQNIHLKFDYYDYEKEKYINEEELISLINELESEINTREKYLSKYLNNEIEDEELKSIKNGDSFTIYEKENLLNKYYMSLQNIEEAKTRKKEISLFIDEIFSSDIQVSLFKDKKSSSSLIDTFINETINETFFTLYIPHKQFLSEEFDDFINLFEKYLQKIKKLKFTIDSKNTITGKKYSFRCSENKITKNTLSDEISNFNDFLELCSENPSAAELLLSDKILEKDEISDLIKYFSKKYKRIKIDIKHEQERLILALNHEFENTIIELNDYNNTTSFLKKSTLLDETSLIQSLNQTIKSSLKKNVYYTSEDEKILEVASKYGNEKDLIDIKSNIEILRDSDTPKKDRISAVDKIKIFLIKVGKKSLKHAKEIGIKVLTKYLESKVNGNLD